jgi:hypothetical protein
MATTVNVIVAKNAADAISQANTYLAGLNNPIIRKLDLSLNDAPNRVNTDWRITIQTQTGGAGSSGTWMLQAMQATSPAGIKTLINDAFTAVGSGFIGGVELDSLDDGLSGKQPFWGAIFLYNSLNTSPVIANYDLR